MTELPVDKYEYKLRIALAEAEKQVNAQIRLHCQGGWLSDLTILAKNGLWYYTLGPGTLPYIEKKVGGRTASDAMYQNKRAWAFLATLYPKASSQRCMDMTQWMYLTTYDPKATQLDILENRLYLNETLLGLLPSSGDK